MGYIFDIETLETIARRGMGKPHDEMVRTIVAEVAAAYPSHVDANLDRR